MVMGNEEQQCRPPALLIGHRHFSLSFNTIPRFLSMNCGMWEGRVKHGGGRKMHAAESDIHERLDHVGIVTGVCQESG
jgi:hypothetical protein